MAGIGSEASQFFRRLGLTGEIAAVLMILFGILIIVFPALIAWLIGLYLIIAGVVQLAGHMGSPRR